MTGKHGRLRTALVMWTVLLAPATALAGPYLGEWGLCWHPGRDCPRGEYCPLHYWLPEFYKVRANVHPSNLNEYSPGPSPAVSPAFQAINDRCRTIPPAPTSPYTDPAGYYGRSIVPK